MEAFKSFIAIFLFCVVGCDSIIPVKTVTVPPDESYDAILAWEIATQVSTIVPTPAPTPPEPPAPVGPKVGDKCPKCNGTGKTPGDGTVNPPCWACKGDGKVDTGDPILLPQETHISIVVHAVKGVEGRLTEAEKEIVSLKKDLGDIKKEMEKVKVRVGCDVPHEATVEKQVTYSYTYSIIWNGLLYTWNDSQGKFISPTGRTITIQGHPRDMTYIKMGCETGVCTIVPITVTKVEVKDGGDTQNRELQNGNSQN